MVLSSNPLSFIDPDGGMDGEGLGLFDHGQIGRDGRLALQFTTNAFDQFQEMCPTCNSMDIFDLYVSMRKNGVVDPSLMADMATDLVKTGEREERFLDFENNAVHIFQIHELESRPNARFASLQNNGGGGDDWSFGRFYDGLVQGGENLRKSIESTINNVIDGNFSEVARKLHPLQRCDNCSTGLNTQMPQNSFEAGQLAFGLFAAAIPGGRNRINHIFGNPQHALGGLVRQFGSREKAFNAVQNAANKALLDGNLTPNAKGILPSGDACNIILVGGTPVRLIGGRVDGNNVIISSFSRKGF